MKYYDSHCHILINNENIGTTLKRCTNSKIQIISIGYNIETSRQLSKIGQPHTVGIHPAYAMELENLEDLEGLINCKTLAIGETGLDALKLSVVPLKTQTEKFIMQIELAKKYNLPLIIHCRDLNPIMLEIVKKYSKLSGIWHCFNGSYQDFLKLPKNIFIGINSRVFRRKSGAVIDAILKIPIARVLIQTDWPYVRVGRRPYRYHQQGLKDTYQAYSKLKNIKIEKLCDIIQKNFLKLFKNYYRIRSSM